MVAKGDVLTAVRLIAESLEEFVQHGASTKVHVFETEWGHLRALVGSDGFQGMSLGKRQEVVWEYLREHVPAEYLSHLVAVHPMDIEEYNANVMQAGFASGRLEMFTSGSEEGEEGEDRDG